jgi:SSS family solute:Na+ symporter
MFETNFTALDWGIVTVYLLGSVAIGIFVNKYIHNVGDYMVGGRASGAALNTATYIGTGLGLVTLMYASMDAFTLGFAYVTIALMGAAIGVFLGSTGFVITRLRELELTTVPEYFEKRFNRETRITAGVICAVAGILNMGLFPRMGAAFITFVTGLGSTAEEPAVMIKIITTLLVVLVILYTVLGGMVSVIVTDYIQFIVLSIGLGMGVYFCLSHPQLGWERITTNLAQHRGEAGFNVVAEGAPGWIWLIWLFLVIFGAALTWAPEATRALTTKDARTTRLTFLFSGPAQFIRLAIPSLFAVAAFCWVSNDPGLSNYFFPDGLSGAAQHADQSMPLLLGKIVPTGLLGLLVAGLLAAFMSTHDSYLLGWASIITRDIVGPLKGRELSDREQIRLTRVIIVCIGVALIVIGLWMPPQKSVWAFMALTGTIYVSGASAAMIGGMYWRRASSWGARAAMLTGLLSVASMLPNFKQFEGKLPSWYTTPAVCLAVFILAAVVFVVVSLIVPDSPIATEEA